MYLYSIGYTGNIYKQKMSVILSFIPSLLKLAISFFRIKAKNAFYYSPTISPVRLYKYTFFVQYYALIKSIISFKYKDFSSFMDGNNRILCPSKIKLDIVLIFHTRIKYLVIKHLSYYSNCPTNSII
mgnify:FL=1